ncbi:putative P450 monooxygenase [Tricladium varicosporioides]|nr:putative P450 monooxygenase [Hymenoscyphus varicosporioides]
MATSAPLLWLITLPSAVLCAINVVFFPQILPETPLSKLFLGISSINFSLWVFYSVFIYPFFLSPLRHLPQPKGSWPIFRFGKAAFERPAGEAFLKFMKTVPNDGLINVPGFFNVDAILPTSPDALADILVHKNYDFEKPSELRLFLRRILGDGLILTEGDEHKFQRKHITPAFSFRHIKELVPIFWSKSAALCEGITTEMGENSGIVEVNHWANKVTLDIIGVAGLGRDFRALTNADDPLVKNYEEILEPTKEKLAFFVCNMLFGRRLISMLPWKLNERLNETTVALKDFCHQLVRDKKVLIEKHGEEQLDILSLLIKSNCFSNEVMVDQLLTFIAAGHETTSSTFTWATYLLAKHPEIQTRLHEEVRSHLPSPSSSTPNPDISSLLESLPYLHAVCHETIRLYPAVPVTIRISVNDSVICGVPLPKGTRIQLSPWAINRSPKIWGPTAEDFNPDRWIDADGSSNNTGGVTSNYCNLTFLHGPRSCIGEKFAKSELKALVAVFCGTFKMEMADPNEIATPAGVITTKPQNGMTLRLKKIEGW